MAEDISISGDSRAERYQSLHAALRSVIEDEPDLIANLANACALIHQAFGFHWVGFYRKIGEQLVLGPFQGPVACTRIKIPEGVCGACVERAETIIVPDVEAFPGHIACSSLSKSEIVVPLVQNSEVKLVLDIDSVELDDFSNVDAEGLGAVMQLLDEKYPPPNPLLRMPKA